MKARVFYYIAAILTFLVNNQLKAQNREYLKLAIENTFGGDYLNQWLLINEGDIKDSINIIEGSSGKLKYSEIEGQCKYLTTKNGLIVIDDEDQVIYQWPANFQTHKKKSGHLGSFNFDTAHVTKDSLTLEGKYIFYSKSESGDFEIQIDVKTLRIDWIRELENIEIYNENTHKEEWVLITKKFNLVSHINGKESLTGYMNIGSYIKSTDDGYVGVGKYMNYEIINLEN